MQCMAWLYVLILHETMLLCMLWNARGLLAAVHVAADGFAKNKNKTTTQLLRNSTRKQQVASGDMAQASSYCLASKSVGYPVVVTPTIA